MNRAEYLVHRRQTIHRENAVVLLHWYEEHSGAQLPEALRAAIIADATVQLAGGATTELLRTQELTPNEMAALVEKMTGLVEKMADSGKKKE